MRRTPWLVLSLSWLGCAPPPCPACPPPYVEPLTQAPVEERCDRLPSEADQRAEREDHDEVLRVAAALSATAPEKVAVEAARQALERGDAAACAKVLEPLPHDDAPAPLVLLEAACQQQLGRWRDARGLLAHALERRDAAGASWQPLVQRWSARLAATSPKLVVRLDGPYLPDSVSVSSRHLPTDALGRTFSLDPGKHTLHATRDNPLANAHADLVARVGCTTTVPLRLERAVYFCMTAEESECLRRSSRGAVRACQERLEQCRERCRQLGR